LRVVARRRAQLLQQLFRPLTDVRAARAVTSAPTQRHRLAVLGFSAARGERERERELVAGPRSSRQLGALDAVVALRVLYGCVGRLRVKARRDRRHARRQPFFHDAARPLDIL